jgi:hypothetical protein
MMWVLSVIFSQIYSENQEQKDSENSQPGQGRKKEKVRTCVVKEGTAEGLLFKRFSRTLTVRNEKGLEGIS